MDLHRCAYDVRVAYLLAMQGVWVQVPLGALTNQDVGKPGIPRVPETRDRWFKSNHPDLMIAVGSVLVREGGC